MKTAFRALLAIALLAASQMSCNVNDYCLNCATGDGGGSNDDGGDGDGNGSNLDDGGTDGGCVVTGPEECDGKDNDCDGFIDNGTLPMVGTDCSNQMGACAGGKLQCVSGALKCDKNPQPEICNAIDDNCNGVPDEGDPGGGAKCGTDMGECVAGTFRCNAATGVLDCIGFQDHRMDAELCDGKDNDCDGSFDEGLTNLGSCGPATNVGACEFGQLSCTGGAPFCGAGPNGPPVFPKFETCNNTDDDCDMAVDEVFNKQIDTQNCGTCGTVCPPHANANTRCNAGTCGFQCKPGFVDLSPAVDGCEYACFPSGNEACDGIDNDCNGIIDDNLTPPSICRSGGECGATAPTAQCMGAAGWSCTYPGDVQFPETKCDGLNNDCDANIDEGQPNKNLECNDGRQGACRGTGTYICDAANLDGPAVCDITSPGQTNPDPAETCDDRDNDCDGAVDEGAETGNLIGQEWVSIGGGHQIMKYEASRFDSSPTQQGTEAAIIAAPLAASPTGATFAAGTATYNTLSPHGLAVGSRIRISGVTQTGYNGVFTVATVPTATRFTVSLAASGLTGSGGGAVSMYKGSCSKAGVMPWTNVTYPEALAVCESMGASLCTETRWHQACGVVAPSTFPLAVDASNGTRIEAEDFYRTSSAGGPETSCNDSVDNDGDGATNDGCPIVISGVGPESGPQCDNAIDDDGDGRANDGCPTTQQDGETGAQCDNATNDDNDNRTNDGCPAFTLGAGPESGAQCNNAVDDDGDGRVNDGCPRVGGTSESGNQCTNATDNDGDTFVNDGCPSFEVGAGAETTCTGNTDNDFDGKVNDGCPVVSTGVGPETACGGSTDDDGDGAVNDGCPSFDGAGEVGAQCTNAVDDDGDGVVNDGCPELGAQAWAEDYTPAPQENSGMSNMRAVPNLGTSIPLANATTSSPRLDYQVSFPTAASDWRIYVRMYSAVNADNTLHVGVGASLSPLTAPTMTLTTTANNAWQWIRSPAINITTAGDQFVSLYMAQDGLKVDAIFIVRGTTVTPPATLNSAGGNWSYATNPTTYQAATCNGADQSSANDNILTTGALTSCFADHALGDVFDMSGNVREWTKARSPGQNPIRGGSSSDLATGISCPLNFSLASDAFFFPNVGFRCCR